MRGRRVREHAGGLDHDRERVVPVANLDRGAARNDGAGLGELDLDRLAADQSERLRTAASVDRDPATRDRALDVGARGADGSRHHRVEPARRRDEPISHRRRRLREPPEPPPLPARPEPRAGGRRSRSTASAALNTGQTRRSTKSITRPDRPGPRTIRSIRLPAAPPSTSPSAMACAIGRARNDVAAIARHTTIAAIAKSNGARSPRQNAPPLFVVYRNRTTPSSTSRGWSGSARSAQSLVTRSTTRTMPAVTQRMRPPRRRAASTGALSDATAPVRP